MDDTDDNDEPLICIHSPRSPLHGPKGLLRIVT